MPNRSAEPSPNRVSPKAHGEASVGPQPRLQASNAGGILALGGWHSSVASAQRGWQYVQGVTVLADRSSGDVMAPLGQSFRYLSVAQWLAFLGDQFLDDLFDRCRTVKESGQGNYPTTGQLNVFVSYRSADG